MMKVTYPNFLRGQDETSTKRLWWTHLEGTDPKKIDSALRDMVEHYPKFAPTIGEFKKLIREQVTETNQVQGLPICKTCKATKVTRRHFEMCVEKSIEPERYHRKDPDEIRAQLKEFFNGR